MLGRVRFSSGVAIALLLVFTLAPAAGASVRPGDDEAAILSDMQLLYSDALVDMDLEGIPREGTLVIVVDAAKGYEYTEEEGLRPLVPSAVDTGEGPFPALVDQATDEVGTSLGEGPLKALRRVKTIYRPFRVEGDVRLPVTLTGVDGAEGYDEGAFNYFGVDSASVNAEIGVCTRVNLTKPRNDGGRWYYYYAVPGPGFQETTWPAGGIAPGTTVTLRLVVGLDSIMGFIDAGGSRVYSKTYDVPGADPLGTSQRLRRLTTMVLANTGGSMTASWSGVTLYTHNPNHPPWIRLWGTSDTYYSPLPRLPDDPDSSPISYPSPGVTPSGPLDAETVWIKVP